MNHRSALRPVPPADIHVEFDALLRLEPPAGLLDELMREVVATPQERPVSRFAIGGALAGIAAAAVVAALLVLNVPIRPPTIGDPTPSEEPSVTAAGTPSPTPAPASPRPTPSAPFETGGLSVAASVEAQLPAEPGDAIELFAFDSLWIGNELTGVVKRLDPATNTVVAEIPLRPESPDRLPIVMASDGASLWAAPGGEQVLLRIDPEANEVVDEVRVAVRPYQIALVQDTAWITEYNNFLVQVRLSDGEELHRMELSGAAGVAFDGTWIWANSFATTGVVLPEHLLRIDPETGEVVDDLPLGGFVYDLAVDGRFLYAGAGVRRDPIRPYPASRVNLDTDEIQLVSTSPVAVTTLDGMPWAVYGAGVVASLDSITLEVTGYVELPARETVDLVSGAGSLWTVGLDGVAETDIYRLTPSAP